MVRLGDVGWRFAPDPRLLTTQNKTATEFPPPRLIVNSSNGPKSPLHITSSQAPCRSQIR
jgi:hypothetical protein